jgi:hypothetical protein
LNKKILALAIAFLMILGTFSVMTPPANAFVNPLPVLNTTFGPAGSTVTITAPGPGAVTTALTPNHQVFVFFDRETSDTDLGLPLHAFGAADMFVDINAIPAGTIYSPGEPLYRDIDADLRVSVGDLRLTPRDAPGGFAYDALSFVVAGDADIIPGAPGALTAIPATMMWTDASAADNTVTPGSASGFKWDGGDGIYMRDASNVAAGHVQVGAGDIRVRYPSLTARMMPDGITGTYAAWTKVRAPILDFYKSVYNDVDANGFVSNLDVRLTNVAISPLRYAAGSTVTLGQEDLASGLVTTTAFGLTDAFVDANANALWDPGEAIYRTVAAVTPVRNILAGDIRLSYANGYLYGTTVVAGDPELLAPTQLTFWANVISNPVIAQYYFDADASLAYNFGEWIYTQVVGPGALVAGDVRASAVDWTDKSMASTGTLSGLLPAIWAAGNDWANVVGYIATSVVACTATAGNADCGRALRQFAATDKFVPIGGVFTAASGVYSDLDNDAFVSAGDIRQSLIYNRAAVVAPRTFAPGPWPWTAANAFFLMPGSTVAATDLDAVPALTAFSASAVDERYYDPYNDGTYLGSDLVATGGTDNNGNAMPFPVTWSAAPGAPVPISFTVPANTPPGKHVVFIITDEPPTPALAGQFVNAGFQAAAPFPLPPTGTTLNTEPLPWVIGPAAPVEMWGLLVEWGTQAGYAVFVSQPNIRVFLHPGVADQYKPGWSHTLDTLWGTQAGPLGDPVPGAQPGTNRQTREFFDHYLDYAILASASDSIGDLQFDVTVPAGSHIHRLQIWVPPEFRWASDLDPAAATARQEAVWTDITNDYEFIAISTRNAYDAVAPGWRRLTIGEMGAFAPVARLTINAGTWHVRLFHLAAPSVAGIYHFKIYTDGLSIGAGNYPIIVVKAELNPAWIEVTVRTNNVLAPPFVSGSVLAEGSTPEGRAVSAIGYWGPAEFWLNSPIAGQVGALYRLFLMGVAPGSYTLKAEASGFDPTTTPRLEVFAGQSYHQFIVIYDSPDTHVTIWSKHGTGAIPWHNLWQAPYGTNDPAAAPNNLGPWRDMFIDLRDADGNLIAYWGSDVMGNKIIPLSNRLIGLHDDAGCVPEANQFNGWLVDNFDLLGNLRMFPSTHWDGHVPWDTPDYIAGMPAGQYSVEAYVTGYIMDETDAYQRSFTLSNTATALQFDLRRSNWLEVVLHLPAGVFLSADTSVDLTAEDAGGAERASAAFLATNAMSLNGVLDGLDVSGGTYAGGIVIEGYNALFPNPGYGDELKDSGLNPTASSHSGGAVVLNGNPYTIKLHMADMGDPSGFATGAPIVGTGWYNIVGTPQASVYLCNSPVSLSFDIVNAWLWISLRSVDFQIPAHSRPWTFPGSEIMVQFVNPAEPTTVVDALDPTIYGLIQDAGTTVAGFPIVGAPAGSFGVSPFDIDNINAAGQHEHIGLRYCGMDYAGPAQAALPFWGNTIWSALYDARSTSLPAGEYQYYAWTHGYVMRRQFSVSVPFAGGANIEADLIQGGQIRVTMNFHHEGIATPFNGFVRVEVLDAAGELVGASIYGQADPNVWTEIGTPGGAYLPWWGDLVPPGVDGKVTAGAAQGAGFGPVAAFPSNSAGQRAYLSNAIYGVPAARWATWPATNPCDANRISILAGAVTSFDVYGFYWYAGGLARTWAGGWPTPTWGTQTSREAGSPNFADRGMRGTVDIPGWEGSGGGLYSVKVWAFDARGPDNIYGTADDWRMYSMGSELTGIAVPWGGAQEVFVTMNNMATLRGTISWLDMFGDIRPLPWAQISASPGPATDNVPAYSSGLGALGLGPTDPSGAFIMWVPAGSHDVSVSTSEAPTLWSGSAPTQNAQYTVVVSDGASSPSDTRLGGSGVPVPEVPAFAVPLALFAALAASVWLLRKRTLNIPVMMK